jgi:hypothetical protein
MNGSAAVRWLGFVLLVAFVPVAGASGDSLNVLSSVHGYDAGGRVMLPVAGVVRWLGGSVTYHQPKIGIVHGSITVSLTEGSAACTRNGKGLRLSQPVVVYGGVTCLPVRVLADLLGFRVEYFDQSHDGGGTPSEAERMGGNPLLKLTAGNRVARVLVHEEPPGVVARVIADLQNTTQQDYADHSITFRLGDYGTDWILQVKRIHSGFFASTDPAQANTEMQPGQVVFFANAVGVYGYKQGKWRFLLGMQDSPAFRAWDAAGIPRDLAGALGIKLANY